MSEFHKFLSSLSNVETPLLERGIDVCHETVRHWWDRFGPLFASDIRRQKVSRMCGFPLLALAPGRDIREPHAGVTNLNSEIAYLCRAVEHGDEVLESYVTRTCDSHGGVVSD